MTPANPLVEYEVVFAELVTLVVKRGNIPSCIEGNVHCGMLQISVDDWSYPGLPRGPADLRLVAMLATRVNTEVEMLSGRRLVVVTMPILV